MNESASGKTECLRDSLDSPDLPELADTERSRKTWKLAPLWQRMSKFDRELKSKADLLLLIELRALLLVLGNVLLGHIYFSATRRRILALLRGTGQALGAATRRTLNGTSQQRRNLRI